MSEQRNLGAELKAQIEAEARSKRFMSRAPLPHRRLLKSNRQGYQIPLYHRFREFISQHIACNDTERHIHGVRTGIPIEVCYSPMSRSFSRVGHRCRRGRVGNESGEPPVSIGSAFRPKVEPYSCDGFRYGTPESHGLGMGHMQYGLTVYQGRPVLGQECG